MRLRAIMTALLVLLVLASGAPLGAQGTPGLQEARERAAAATAAHDEVLARLGELEAALARLDVRAATLEAQLDERRAEVQAIAVERFTSRDQVPLLLEEDLNRHARADALVRIVTERDADALDRFEALHDELVLAREQRSALRAQQEAALEELAATEAEINEQLAVLEELERERLAEERRRAEEARRRAEEERRRAAAEAAALAAATSTTSAPAATPPPAPTPTPAPAAPPPPVSAPVGGVICPVQGSVFFTDTYGAPRPGGRFHEGVDMMAARGTPVVAPVAGSVVHRGNTLGGLSFYLDGDDGRQYYGTHMDAYGASGRVSAGTVVGYVGSTGNAPESAPHLHFEIMVGGRNINPYPTVAAAC